MSESNIDAGVIQATDIGKVSEIAELIRGESHEPEPAEQDAPGEPVEAPPAGKQPEPDDDPTEPPAIDYDLVIPISASDGDGEGGESQTISQLKDHYQASKSFESDREAWDETRRDQENEQMVARQQLNSLAVMLGEVKPELLKAAQDQMAFNAEHEAQMLLKVYPKWAEPEVKKQASAAMLATAKQYGFTEQQFIGIDDHRVIKVLHDYTVMLGKAKAGREALSAAANLSKAQKPAAPQIKTTTAKTAIEIGRTGTQTDKIRAIGDLIEGSNDGKSR